MVKLCFEHEPSLSLDEKSILDATLVTAETTVIEATKQQPPLQHQQHQPSRIPILTVPPPPQTRSNLITNNHQQSVSDSMVTTRSKIKRQHAFRGGDNNNKVVNENLGVGGEVERQKSAFKSVVISSSSSQSKPVSNIETTKKVGSNGGGGVGVGKSQKKIEVKVGDEDDREYDCDGDEDDSEVVLLVFNRNLPSQSSSAVEQAKAKRPTAVIDANQSQINKVGYLLICFRLIF
jgi:hypothetical protein